MGGQARCARKADARQEEGIASGVHSQKKASGGEEIPREMTREGDSESIGNDFLLCFLYFRDRKWFTIVVGVALMHGPVS